MSKPLKIAIAGLGTVGVGVIKIIEQHNDMIAARAGRAIEVVAVSASNRSRDRGIDITAYDWADNALDFAERDDVDLVVEVIGGSDGVAKELAQQSLEQGKSFVTANKALIAHHGAELAEIAQNNGVALRFEAAVAGGIPIIKSIGEGLAANKLTEVHGILNGTTNYMLTQMEATGKDYGEILEETKLLGYLEADPSLDLDGIDAGHKLAILSSVAFGVKTNFENVYMEGIRRIKLLDIEYAKELGYRIKLLGISRLSEQGLEQRVHPCMVPRSAPIAHVDNGFNAVVVQGDYIDRTFYEGRGAGEGPTASAVVADIIDVARGHNGSAFFVPQHLMQDVPPIDISDRIGSYYIRLHVQEQPGVIADVTATLRDQDVSLQVMLQKGSEQDGSVYIVMVTHETQEKKVTAALKQIDGLSTVIDKALAIRIENL
ncbi:homoserine dehydrogenase [Paremcibacter congregatus]|uniref:Homoserine dehydrogenase n=1 Tax=Paremcibacter congregatus TaxID=2043170 RepID=A0A2G4YTW4_9PROT|nr:homoserine dehydrogenase [Paremcibacter congregatus]PHZ85768.1 homoserine dehydrogenase [Paremcibacter congregatus]QDE26729.1 homoserine dehydrogenase [Paremcibacter congregatus]